MALESGGALSPAIKLITGIGSLNGKGNVAPDDNDRGEKPRILIGISSNAAFLKHP
jgi:hypothetical protein